mmetsp:Transcript_2185/g.3721  ORF Transcript_2185/g.3721 Transcript_2185/m.3721 type:complete len:83 (+) Transcript_2185:45-293(+)
MTFGCETSYSVAAISCHSDCPLLGPECQQEAGLLHEQPQYCMPNGITNQMNSFGSDRIQSGCPPRRTPHLFSRRLTAMEMGR